jgi:hypothetical protein
MIYIPNIWLKSGLKWFHLPNRMEYLQMFQLGSYYPHQPVPHRTKGLLSVMWENCSQHLHEPEVRRSPNYRTITLPDGGSKHHRRCRCCPRPRWPWNLYEVLPFWWFCFEFIKGILPLSLFEWWIHLLVTEHSEQITWVRRLRCDTLTEARLDYLLFDHSP